MTCVCVTDRVEVTRSSKIKHVVTVGQAMTTIRDHLMFSAAVNKAMIR